MVCASLVCPYFGPATATATALAHYAHDATFFSSRNGIINDLCTMQHLLLLPLPITFFVKVSGAIAAAHIICREPFKALVAV